FRTFTRRVPQDGHGANDARREMRRVVASNVTRAPRSVTSRTYVGGPAAGPRGPPPQSREVARSVRDDVGRRRRGLREVLDLDRLLLEEPFRVLEHERLP